MSKTIKEMKEGLMYMKKEIGDIVSLRETLGTRIMMIETSVDNMTKQLHELEASARQAADMLKTAPSYKAEPKAEDKLIFWLDKPRRNRMQATVQWTVPAKNKNTGKIEQLVFSIRDLSFSTVDDAKLMRDRLRQKNFRSKATVERIPDWTTFKRVSLHTKVGKELSKKNEICFISALDLSKYDTALMDEAYLKLTHLLPKLEFKTWEQMSNPYEKYGDLVHPDGFIRV